MRQCTYHRLDKQKRPRHLSKLRSLPQTESYLRHHNSRHSDNKARSTVYSMDGRNEIFPRIHTIWSSNIDNILSKLHPCFELVVM